MKNWFIKSLLSPDGEMSSKRWMGMNVIYFIMICYLCSMLIEGFTEWHQKFMEQMFYGGLGLLGLTAIDKIISVFKK